MDPTGYVISILCLHQTPLSIITPQQRSFSENLRLPTKEEQAERFSGKFESLLESCIEDTPDDTSPENILVLETVGKIEDFKRAVANIPGLDWQAEIDIDEIQSDEEFFSNPKIGKHFFKGITENIKARESTAIRESFVQHGLLDERGNLLESCTRSEIDQAIPEEFSAQKGDIVQQVLSKRSEPISGRLYLSLSNRQALEQLKNLFNADQRGENPPQLNSVWKKMFSHLHDVRYWSTEDRIRDTGVYEYWKEEVDIKRGTSSTVPFEVELTFSSIAEQQETRQTYIENLVTEEGGTVLAKCIIPEIRFHALKIELPVDSIERVLEEEYSALFQSGGILFFRPETQCSSSAFDVGVQQDFEQLQIPTGDPVVALLDGLPLSNHQLLKDYLIIDDPDDHAADYNANDFHHGTAMASLLCHGELDQPSRTNARKIYVRPILKPDDSPYRVERIPPNVFFEDLIERSVRRMFEGEGEDIPPSAPLVKVINLSVADPDRVFHHILGPTARLLDWLSFKYGVLFCVSAGNILDSIDIGTDKNEFEALADEEKIQLTYQHINANRRNRRLFSPSEAINVLSIGALHSDNSPHTSIGNRVDLIPDSELPSPICSCGHGFRSAIKPELLVPGGRQLYDHLGDGVYGVSSSIQPPGQKVAATSHAPGEINRVVYTRGTSNATAITSRYAGLAYDILEDLFTDRDQTIPERNIAPLIKTMLVHGASWGSASKTISGILGLSGHSKQKELSRFLGYGTPDFEKVLECTKTRATVIGHGNIEKNQRHEFSFPLPNSLSGLNVWRKLTITLSWLSPVTADNRKYRRAALEFNPTTFGDLVGGSRHEAQWQQVKNGTIQHEIFEGDQVVTFLSGDGDEIIIPIQCREDANPLDIAIPYGIAVSLEVKEEIDIPIYQEIRESIDIAIRESIGERV